MSENEALTDLKNIRRSLEECFKLIMRGDNNYKSHIERLEEVINSSIDEYRKRGILTSNIELEFRKFFKDQIYFYERLWRI